MSRFSFRDSGQSTNTMLPMAGCNSQVPLVKCINVRTSPHALGYDRAISHAAGMHALT